MKKVFIYMIVTFLVKGLSFAQNLVQNGNFQTYSCNWSSTLGVNDFYNGCLGSQWKSVTVNLDPNNVPQTVTSGGASTGLESGNYFAKLYTTNPSTYSVNYTYQGIYYTGITFTKNTQYTFTGYVRQGVSNQLNVRLSNNLPSSATGTFSVGTQYTSSNSTWEMVTFTFTPDNTYSQLLLYNIGTYSTLELDDIQITATLIGDNSCCSPNIIYYNSSLPTVTTKSIYIKTNSGSSVIVSSGQTVHFQAGEYIELNEGFNAQSNSNFLAYISPCSTNVPVTANAGPDVNKMWGDVNNCVTIGMTPQYGVTYSWSSTLPAEAETWPGSGYGVVHPPSHYALSFSSTSVANPQVCYPMRDAHALYVDNTLTVSSSCWVGSSSDVMRYTYYICYACREGEQEELHGEDIFSSDFLQVFPNPTTGKFEVKISSDEKEYKTIVKDLNGKTIYSCVSNGGQNLLDLTGVSVGIYFITIETDEGIILNDKIMIQ